MRKSKHISNPAVTPRSTTQDAATPRTETAQIELSAKVRRLVDGIRGPFKSFVADFATLTATRSELAPTFMKACGAFQAETGQTFVDFVRVLDSTVGPARADYRTHRAYQSADYLRRLVAQSSRPKVANEGQRAAAPATPLDGMARLLASMLPLLGADQITRLWETVGSGLHWSERQIAGLQHRVESAEALVNVRPPRGAGGTIPQLRIAVKRNVGEDADEEQMPRTGTHG